MHTSAPACPVNAGVASAPVPLGVYCGPMIPAGGWAVCSMESFAGNLLKDVGLSVGFDRNATGAVTIVPGVNTTYTGYDGVLRASQNEHVQSAVFTGPAPTPGIVVQNTDIRPARVMAYPTNFASTAVSPTDQHTISCGLSFFDPTMTSFGGRGSTVLPGNATLHNGTSSLPYHHEYRHTPFTGAATKEICFCGEGAAGAGAGGTVNVVNGEFVARYTALRIESARGMDWEFNLTYRTLSPDATHRNATGSPDFGNKWDYSYGRHFVELPSGDLELHDGDGLAFLYAKGPTVGTITTYNVPLQFYETLEHDSLTNDLTRTLRDGTKERYVDGLLQDITDRNGNQIQFVYNATGALLYSVDQHNRLIDFHYDAMGRIESISDFAGRMVGFVYCGSNLCQIIGLGNTNATFDYDAFGGLTRIYDAKGQLYVQNFYDSEFRVQRQRHGDANQFYKFIHRPELNLTTVFDRNNNRVDHHYVSWDVPLVWKKVVFSNRFVDPNDAPTYTWLYDHNAHFELVREERPNGNIIVFEYDEDNVLVRSKGNLLRRTEDPGAVCTGNANATSPLSLPGTIQALLPIWGQQPGLNPCTPRIHTYTYELAHNMVETYTDPRGNDPAFVPPNGGIATAARYTTTYGHDLNGNPTSILHPMTHPSGAPEGFSPGATAQVAVENFSYNGHGQVVEHFDANGTRHTYDYYPATGSIYNPTDTEGYLKTYTKDAAGLALQTNYTYDVVGSVTEITNPAGDAVQIKYDDRCLMTDFKGPPLFGYQDAVFPHARRMGEEVNVTVDDHGRAIANRTRLAWAVSDNDTQRFAYESDWAALPVFIDWYLLNASQQQDYLTGLRIYENATGKYLRDGIDGDYVALNESFFDGTAWHEDGEFHDLALGDLHAMFLRSQTSVLAQAAAIVGGPTVEDRPLEDRNLTTAAEWAQGHVRMATKTKRDANGQPEQTIHQLNTQDAAAGALHVLPGAKTENTTYNILGQMTQEVVETSPELPDWPTSNKTITRFFYDFNENLVCKHHPLRVQAGRFHNIETWVYNERDLLFQFARGDVNYTLLINHPNPTAMCGGGEICPLPRSCPWDRTPRERHSYDGNGNPIRFQDARGNVSLTFYNGFDEKIVDLDALLNRVETYYDPRGNVIDEKRYEPQTFNTTLTGLLAGVQSLSMLNVPLLYAGDLSNGTLLSWTRNSFDERSRQYETGRAWFGEPGLVPDLLSEEPRFASEWTEQDKLNQVVRRIDANGHASTSEYDDAGRLVNSTDAAGNFVARQYDPAGNVVWEKRRDVHTNGTHHDRIITREYDSMGRLVNETDDQGRRRTIVYSAQNDALGTEDATKRVEKHITDGAGRSIIDYYRMGVFQIEGEINSTFYVPGVEHARAPAVTFTITYRDCFESGCGPPKTCTPRTNATCDAIFTEPCAYLGPEIEVPHNDDCCAFLYKGSRCMMDPTQSGVTNTSVDVEGVFTFPEDAAFGCQIMTWPNFHCPYTGNMSHLLQPTVCTDTLPMDCETGNPYVGGCINQPLCPPMPLVGDLPNGTVVRVYPGPYWDQHAVDGAWDAYSVHHGITINQRHDLNSRLVNRTDGEGHQTKYGYDDWNRQINETYADGSLVRMELDANDNVVGVVDPNGNVLTNTYDELDRLVNVTVVKAPGVIGTDHQAFTYDGLGRRTSSLDEDTADPASAVHASWIYDSLGNVVRETVGDYTVTSTFDGVGNRLTVQYPGLRVVNHTYDELNRLVRLDDITPGILGGQPVLLEEPIAQYEYLGERLTFRHYANGVNRTIEYRNATGNSTLPLRVEDRDDNGTLLVGFEYSYDAADHKTSIRRLHAPDSSSVFTRDPIDRLVGFGRGTLNATGLTLNSAAATGLQAQAWDLTDGNDWNGTTTQTGMGTTASTRQHNSRHELVQETTGSATVNYVYDANGNLVGDGARDYVWDFKNRLVEIRINATGDVLRAYRYDADNRRVSQGAGGILTVFVLDGRQEIEERDSNGALLKQYVFGPGVDEIVFADVYQPVCNPSAPPPCGFISTPPQCLGAANQNVCVSPEHRCFLISTLVLQEVGCLLLEPLCLVLSSQMVCAPPEAEALVENVTALVDFLVSQASLEVERHYYHLDDQHSTIALTNETGVVKEGYEYTPYGKPITYTPGPDEVMEWGAGDDGTLTDGSSVLGNRVLYTGRNWDSSMGLYYYRARYYDSELGRFIGVDPLGQWKDRSAFGNGYSYVGNNPCDFTDPMGEGPLSWAKKKYKKAKNAVKDSIRELQESICSDEGYLDINVQMGFILGVDVGVVFSAEGLQLYGGAGLATPGFGASVTGSMDEPPSPTFESGDFEALQLEASASFILAGTYGLEEDFEDGQVPPPDQRYQQVGWGTPGASIMANAVTQARPWSFCEGEL